MARLGERDLKNAKGKKMPKRNKSPRSHPAPLAAKASWQLAVGKCRLCSSIPRDRRGPRGKLVSTTGLGHHLAAPEG